MPDKTTDGGEAVRLVDDVRASRLPALLDHDEIRALLAHTALVIKPGETLIIRVKDWPPYRVREYQEALDGATEHLGWPKTIVVAGDEIGVMQAPDAPPLAERVRSLATRDRTRG